MENKVVKRFVISFNGIKQGHTMEFTNKKGEKFIYNQRIVFNQLRDKFEGMNCWKKYKTYTSTNNLPKFVRALDTLV